MYAITLKAKLCRHWKFELILSHHAKTYHVFLKTILLKLFFEEEGGLHQKQNNQRNKNNNNNNNNNKKQKQTNQQTINTWKQKKENVKSI